MKMKINPSFALALLAGLATPANATVTFTVTPPTVSNTYSGQITLQIAGVPTGDTVVVQKFLDLNTNGVVDSTDLLVQQFNLTDGQAGMVIGGVTNFNVPGDTDGAANGQITATLNLQNGDFMQNIVGQYLFKLSSPAGHFTPITNLFTVTNFPFGQKITGNVLSNGTSAAVPNAVVLLFPPPQPGKGGPGGNPLAGTVANSSGGFSLQAPPGTYMPVAFAGNYAANLSSAPVLTLAASQTITTNLTLVNATTSISGSVVDANNSSVGLPGVMVPTMSSGGLLAITFTDTNGNFNGPVTAGTWKLQVQDTSLIVHGYVGLNNGTNVSAGATGVTLAVPKATALFYGSVTDNLGNPLAGIDVGANDSSYLYGPDGYTDTNGNYFLGIVGGLTWQIQISSDKSPANFIFSQPDFDSNGGTNINSGQAVLANFTAILATNYITGNVQANGTNIVGVGVNANATINSVNFSQYADTDANGNYSMNVGNGNWNISLNCNGGNDSLDNILGSGNYVCPDNQTAVISNNNATNNFIVPPCGNVIITTTSLPDGQVNVYYNQFLEASSCSSPFNWTNISGSLPPGLILASNGDISGTPTNSGTFDFTVQVTDNDGHSTNQALSLTINPSELLQITTGSLPYGVQGVWYSQPLGASGGQPPYSWSLAPDSASLPAGLTLATNGILSGTPASSGTFSFDIQVTDSSSNTVDQPLSLTIYSATSVIIVMQSDASTLATALGPGVPSDPVFSQLDSGDISGLSFQAADVGAFGSGTQVPEGAPSGTQVINIPPDDGENGFFKVSFVLPAGFQAIQLAGAANVDDYGRAFLNGNPISSSMSSDDPGRINEFADTPFSTTNAAFFQVGTNDLVIADANTGGGPSAAAFYAVVNFQTNGLQILTTLLPGGTANVAYGSQPLSASGGQPPYSWSLASGMLPPGLSLSTNGVISGTPTTTGTSNFVVQVMDSVMATATQALSVTITNGAPVPDVQLYYLGKMEAFLQTGAATVAPNPNNGPFSAFAGIVQSSLDSVPIANMDLPSGAVAGFPPGGSGIELKVQTGFATQAALDAAYTNGNYTFAMATRDNGFQFPVLTLPVVVYPATPLVSNFAAAQAINPLNPFTLQWNNPPDATTNDFIWVTILNGSGATIFGTPYPATNFSSALNGTVTSVLVPTNTFQWNGTYTGVITFFRVVNANPAAYPGALGLVLVNVQTAFPLAAPLAAPGLSQPARTSGTQFSFQLSGLTGQNYTILATTNLAVPMSNWVPVLTTNLSVSPVLIRDSQATNKQKFYRVKVGP